MQVLQFDSRSAEEARSASRDNSELNQLARMMPDPAEDELFDDSKSSLLPNPHCIALLGTAYAVLADSALTFTFWAMYNV